MELSVTVRAERAEQAKRRREAIKNNKFSKEQLAEILRDDAVLISSRDSSCDTHEIIIWTPAFNKKFRELPRLVGDRDPTNERLNELKMKIGACRLPLHWDVAYCEAENEVFRLNGNTTSLLASVEENFELFEGATIYYTSYMCSTADEYKLIYSQFDPRTSMRSQANALLPYIVAFGVGIQPTMVPQILSAINMVHHVSRSKAVRTVEDKAMLLHHSLPFLYWLEENIYTTKVGYAKPFFRVCVAAAIYTTWLSAYRDKAIQFWKRVIYTNEHTYAPGDPCLALNHLISSTPGPRSEGDTREVLEQYVWCLMAWNAFIQGKTVTAIRVVSGRTPPAVSGISKLDAKNLKLLHQMIPEKRPSKAVAPVETETAK